MNLRIADPAGLVAFLHRVVSTSGTPILSNGLLHVVEVDGRIFFYGDDPLTVGGPFASLEALLRSEGLRRHREPSGTPAMPSAFEVFEWAGSFFRIDAHGEPLLRQSSTLEEACHRSLERGAL